MSIVPLRGNFGGLLIRLLVWSRGVVKAVELLQLAHSVDVVEEAESLQAVIVTLLQNDRVLPRAIRRPIISLDLHGHINFNE